MKPTHWTACITIGIALLGGVARAETSSAVDLSNEGWRLWLDPQASWKDDVLYLPDQVDLAKLPVNPPTGGWATLSATAGIPVTLPGTVEEHYWSSRLSKDASPLETVEHDGSYTGVSWWYRRFTAPKLADHQHCLIEIGASRLRAEIFVNDRLVGYNLISELPFTVDVTPALKPGGENLLAIRITNPGGQLAWDDTATIEWGKYRLPMSHGFGGLDKGIRLVVRGESHVSNLIVLNTPAVRTIKVSVDVTAGGEGYRGPVAIELSRDGKTAATGSVDADVPAGKTVTVAKEITVPTAELWDIAHPVLYAASARLPKVAASEAQTSFGFRWFTAEGIGSNATLRLNGRRIVVRSSISWGFWAPNGMFPDDAAIAREISAVKALGLNSLQNHRHMPNGHVLDGYDHAGLLRYCEAGSGLYSFTDHPWADDPTPTGDVNVSDAGGAPKSFTARYAMFKILGMVRAFRSHPSVSVWTLQNEISPDLRNPSIYWMLRKVHELDPSRLVVLKSGINPNNQALMLPYADEVLHGDKDGVSGWWDQHNAMDSRGVYIDSMYRSPTEWQFRSENTKEIVCWGEMATGASPDDHSAIAAWYADGAKPGYDRLAAETVRDAYAVFLSQWGFASAFPTPERLFLEAGNKHYFSAARVMENARMSDPVDYVVLSGWESTIIDNHSGLVDAMRGLKGDPAPLRRAGADELLVLRPRNYVVAIGSPIVFDAHLINEARREGPQRLVVTVKAPDGRAVLEKTDTVTAIGGETFGQLLKTGYSVDATQPGHYLVTATLTAESGQPDPLERREQVLVVDPQPAPIKRHVAIWGDSSGDVARILKERFGVDAAPFATAGAAADRIVLDSSFSRAKQLQSHFVWGSPTLDPADKSIDKQLFTFHLEADPGDITKLALPNGRAKVELFFGDTTHDKTRAFDVALNGKTVLEKFNPENEPDGASGIVRSFDVEITGGSLALSIPAVQHGSAVLTAMRVTDSSGKIVRRVFRDSDFRDRYGQVWEPADLMEYDFAGALRAVLPRVREGAQAVLIIDKDLTAAAAGRALGAAGVVQFDGIVPHSGASWNGSWYFGRKHWLLDGLPADCVWDWPYQTDSGEANALMLAGDNVEGVVGFGRSHDPRLGFGVATIGVGKGRIVVLCLPGLTQSVGDPTGYHGIHPVTAHRLLYNALK